MKKWVEQIFVFDLIFPRISIVLSFEAAVKILRKIFHFKCTYNCTRSAPHCTVRIWFCWSIINQNLFQNCTICNRLLHGTVRLSLQALQWIISQSECRCLRCLKNQLFTMGTMMQQLENIELLTVKLCCVSSAIKSSSSRCLPRDGCYSVSIDSMLTLRTFWDLIIRNKFFVR